MSELIQGLQVGWEKPFFILYVIHSGYAINLIPWAAFAVLRRKSHSTMNKYYPMRSLIGFAFLLQLLAAWVGYTWYCSLPSTLASANNAVYQSSSLIVYILSVPLLGEAVTAPKVLATAFAICGVCLVSFSTDDSNNGQQSVGGYTWLMLSVFSYALYEIGYSKVMQRTVSSKADDHSMMSTLCRACANPKTDERPSSVDDDGSDLLEDTGGSGAPSRPTHIAHEASPLMFEAHGDFLNAADRIPSRELTLRDALPDMRVRAEASAFVLGWMGIWSLLTLWPGFFLLHYTGIEPFELPSADKSRMLALNTFLDALYNLLLLVGILITSPLYMSLGSMLVVPATVAADWLLHGKVLPPQAGGGVFLILCGFVLLQLPPGSLSKLLPESYRRSTEQSGAAAAVRPGSRAAMHEEPLMVKGRSVGLDMDVLQVPIAMDRSTPVLATTTDTGTHWHQR